MQTMGYRSVYIYVAQRWLIIIVISTICNVWLHIVLITYCTCDAGDDISAPNVDGPLPGKMLKLNVILQPSPAIDAFN